jgi:dihydroxy-acid dehydratase
MCALNDSKGGKKMSFQPKEIRQYQRGLFKSQGYSDGDVSRPLIGIANSFAEGIAGHMNYRTLVDYVRRGVYRAGGVTSEFGVTAVCDGMANGNAGMHSVLPTREVIADSIELAANANSFDGLVLLASCDKIVPAALMAAARLDIPSILLLGGPMMSAIEFNGRKADLTSLAEAMGMVQQGKLGEQDLLDLTDLVCPTCGSCQFYGTANTMCALTEAMGMTLTGSALIPAPYLEKLRDSVAVGEKIVELIDRGITPRKILTMDAIKNGIKVAMATGGSTNAVLHLLAIAHELGFDTNEVLPLFNEYNDTTPQIVEVNPNGPLDMEDFYKAGGIPRVMKNIENRLNLDVMTVTGDTLRKNLDTYRFKYPEDKRVIRTQEEPFNETGGLVLLRGNLAPDTAVAKPSGIHPDIRKFTGEAIVFDSEDECAAAIEQDKVKAGNVIVVRYEGAKGGPGMREMMILLKVLMGKGLLTQVALITDGRFSGTNNGCFVGHISPEAALGGPIAIVRNGDRITVDTTDKREVTLHLSDEEIAARLAEWKYEPKKLTGALAKYVKLVQSAGTGCILE